MATNSLAITVVYDNNPYNPKLQARWGFACVVQGMSKTILFDTGGNGPVLLENMKTLGINPSEIDIVVLSHRHYDHVGGLMAFLATNSNVTVYLPKSLESGFKNEVRNSNAKIVEVHNPMEICDGVYSTGELGLWLKEQSLVIRTGRGSVVITGCAHPGIVKIVKAAKSQLKSNILLVMGGFHLGAESKHSIRNIVTAFKALGVSYVGPCHCSGDIARQLFEAEYKDHFIRIGVGKQVTVSDLL